MRKYSKEEILESLKNLEEIINKEISCLQNSNQEKCKYPETGMSYLKEKDVTDVCKNYLDYLVSLAIKKVESIQKIRELLSFLYREGRIRIVKPEIYDKVAYYSTRSRKIFINSSEIILKRCLENHENSEENLDIVDKILIESILHEVMHAYDHQINNGLNNCIENIVSEIKAYAIASTIIADIYLVERLLEDSIRMLRDKVEPFSFQKLILINWIESCRRYLNILTGSSINIPEIREKYEDLMKKINRLEELYKCYFQANINGSLIGGILSYYLLQMDIENRRKFIDIIIDIRTLDDVISIFKKIREKTKPLDIDLDFDTENKGIIINYRGKKYFLNIKN